MTVQYNDFIAAAERSANGEHEIDARNAVSRAYYAAHHFAKENVSQRLGNGHMRFATGSHEQIIHCYLEAGSVPCKAIAYVLRDLKKNREEADYRLSDATVTFLEAQQAVGKAKALIQRIDNLPVLGEIPASSVAAPFPK